ncbi:MAG: iduronate-2-sulfatase, partial [Ekhidna sp.]|nr:iduronate-2-sulfatase [Ekhidna sp.]
DKFHESVISPLIIRAPQAKPLRQESVIELLDVYPTLLDLAGINASDHLEGESMVGLMSGDGEGWKDYAIVESKRGGKAVYTQEWSFMDWGNGAYELYDLKNDPFQFSNVAESNPDLIKELKSKTISVDE